MKALLFVQQTPSGPRVAPAAQLVGALLALTLVCAATFFAVSSLAYEWRWSSVARYQTKFLEGWLVTLAISAAALGLSSFFGGLAAAAQRSAFVPLRSLSSLYVVAVRGTPLLVQILILYYIFADALGIGNRYLAGVLILSLFSGAYLCEIFRSGIETVGRAQLLSAKSIGLTEYQTFRYVVLPQALRHSLPAIAGQFANLVKDSSLLSVIAVSEFTLNAQEVNALTLSTFEGFLPLALGYLALTLPIMGLARYFEKRLRFAT